MGSIKKQVRPRTKNSDFNQYLLTEYSNIAEAHFRTIEAISSFFRYYLIIMALPITLYSAIIGLSPEIGEFIYALAVLASIISLIIAFVGLCVLLYIVNLRMDVILYARTVNSIRKYFYDNADLDLETKLRMRTLPQTPSLPGYFEPSYFLPVIISFSIFNMAYFFLGLALSFTPLPSISDLASLNSIIELTKDIPFGIWIVSPIFFIIHFLGYYLIARHRELAYLKSYTVGVDIDGVLNKHRQHFCRLLDVLLHKQLEPGSICKIPVHEQPSLGVSRNEEKQIFNNSMYWTKMPCEKGAVPNIRRLRNALKLKVHIFSHRPWPSDEILESIESRKEWEDAAIFKFKSSNFTIARLLRKLQCRGKLYNLADKAVNRLLILRMRTKYFLRLGLKPIDIITKCWLQQYGIEYDKLTIERGSEDVSDPQGHFRNRFYISRKKKLRFFVEDDHEKASKLAYICDLVFLMEHPYNVDKELPDNVIRVKSWDEIYYYIRRLSCKGIFSSSIRALSISHSLFLS